MAAPSHRRLTRKDLRRPDEFVTTLDRLSEFIADNLSRVVIGVVAAIAATAIGFVISFYVQHQKRVASEQFYSGINALSEKRYGDAVQDFSAVAGGSPHTDLGRLAHFYLATTYLLQHQTDKARDQLRAYLADSSEQSFRQLAFVQLGVIDEDRAKYRDAHDEYKQAAQIPGPQKSRAEMGVARSLALMGNRKGAIDAYQRFLKENPFATERPEVVEALAQMGVAASVIPSLPPELISK